MRASRQSQSKKTPQWKSGAIVIGWTFTGIVAVTFVVALGSHLLWGKLGPLHLAARDGDVARCERLVKGGIAVDTPDGEGDTALDWAVYSCKIDVVRKLIELGANVNHSDGRGLTPLMFTATALEGHFLKGTQVQRNQIAQILIEQGADVNLAAGNGRALGDGQTTLHFAATDRNAELVRMLLAAGVNRSARTNQGYTALDVAKVPDYAPNEEVIRALEGR